MDTLEKIKQLRAQRQMEQEALQDEQESSIMRGESFRDLSGQAQPKNLDFPKAEALKQMAGRGPASAAPQEAAPTPEDEAEADKLLTMDVDDMRQFAKYNPDRLQKLKALMLKRHKFPTNNE